MGTVPSCLHTAGRHAGARGGRLGTRLAGASLCAWLLVLPAPVPGLASELEPGALTVQTTADSVVVAGGHFGLTWSASRGGDLTSIRVFDGVAWHELVARGPRRTSVPGVLVYTPEGPLGPFTRGRITVEDQTPGQVVVRSEVMLASERKKESSLALRATYTVFPEGAVFLDLSLALPEQAKPIPVTRASLGWPVETQGFTLGFWHWQGELERGSGMLEPQPTFTTHYAPNVGLALGTAGSISNQLQMTVESSRSLKGSGVPVVSSVRDGRNFVTWILPEQRSPFELGPGFTYANCFGLLLGTSPRHSRLTGHRLAHWIEEEGDGMVYPSASAIEAMALAGATGLVLGPGWRARGGRDGNVPVDDAEFRRAIAGAHAAGLLCLVTVTPGGDGAELGRWARGLGLDGLLIMQASTHYGALATAEVGFPARASFEWMRALRRALGPDAILITQSGLEVPDLSFGLLADGIAFGLERADWRAASSTLTNAYLGGSGYAVPCPLATREAMQTARAMAIAAATGSVPLIPVGFDAGRTVTSARYALPLWQVMRLVPPGPAVEVRTTGVNAVSASSNVDFWSALYRISDTAALLVTANLSPAERDSTAIWVDFPAIGFSGVHDVEVLAADTIEELSTRHAGSTSSGRLLTGAIDRDGIFAMLFVRGDMPEWAAEGLDRGLKMASVFFDSRVPGTVTGLTVRPMAGGLALSWEPASDNQHVALYRIYRSADVTFKRTAEISMIGEAYEETRYLDLAVAPGTTWSYAVSAVDVNGNEGTPSPTGTGSVPSGARNWVFTDSTAARDFRVVSGAWRVDDSAYGSGCGPGANPLAQSVVPDLRLPDVEVTAWIDGPGGAPYSGGIACRADDHGNSLALVLGGRNHDEVTLARIESATMTPLATAYCPYLRPGRSAHTLRLRAVGATITGFVDGRELVQATAEAGAPATAGGVGFVALRGHVHFDNLTVSPAAGAP